MVQLLSVEEYMERYMRAATYSNFTDSARQAGKNIPGNMPYGYIVHLVRTGKVDLKGLIDIGPFHSINGYEYYFRQSNDYENTLVFVAVHQANHVETIISKISYDDFARLPSWDLKDN